MSLMPCYRRENQHKLRAHHQYLLLSLLSLAMTVHSEINSSSRLSEIEQSHAKGELNTLTQLQSLMPGLEAEPAVHLRALGDQCLWTAETGESKDSEDIIKLAYRGLQEADQLNLPGRTGAFHLCLAIADDLSAKTDDEEKEIEQAIRLSQNREDHAILASATVLRGELRDLRGQITDALTDLKTGYQMHIEDHDLDGELYALTAIANLYVDKRVGDYPHALEYYAQLLSAYEQLGNKKGVSMAHFNMAASLSNIGSLEQAQQHLMKALAIDRELKDSEQLAFDQLRLGELLFKQNKTQEALAQVTAAVEYFSQGNNPSYLMETRLKRGEILQKMGRPRDALLDLDAARDMMLADPTQHYAMRILDARAQSLADLGDWQSAYHVRSEQIATQDAFNKKMNDEETARLHVQFDTEKKDSEFRLLKAEQAAEHETVAALRATRLWQTALIGVSIATLLLVSFLLLRTRRAHQQVSLVNHELQIKENKIGELNARMSEVLQEILPEPIAARVVAGEYDIADSYADVTVLFADLVHFTEMSRSISPRELVSLLNEVFSTFDAIAEENGVEKIKTIGDAYLAASGLPMESTRHAENVATMALQMRDALQRIAKERSIGLSIRIGIHTGPVVAGVIGKKRYIYDLWGDTVNFASRMESTAQHGSIQVSEATAVRLRDKYELGFRGEIEVKGRGRQEAYVLLGLKPLSTTL